MILYVNLLQVYALLLHVRIYGCELEFDYRLSCCIFDCITHRVTADQFGAG